MSLTYGLSTPRDLLSKLEREYNRLGDQVNADNVFNFVVTAYHIVDWLRNATLPQGVKEAAKTMYSDPQIAVCRDLANASKHFELREDYKNQVTDKTSVIADFGSGRYGKGPFGVGEPTILIVLKDGTRYDVLDLARQTLEAWTRFFAEHGI